MTDPTYPPLTAEEFAKGCGYTYRGVPICEDEDGAYVFAYGHVPAATFVKVIADFDEEMAGYGLPDFHPDDVEHVWAVTTAPANAPDGWMVEWVHDGRVPVAADEPGAFALTVVTR